MITVYKYPLCLDTQRQVVDMPRGASVLFVASQRETVCLWAQVDTELPDEGRVFHIFGTGHEMTKPIGSTLAYVGSATTFNATFVWHIYEETKP